MIDQTSIQKQKPGAPAAFFTPLAFASGAFATLVLDHLDRGTTL